MPHELTGLLNFMYSIHSFIQSFYLLISYLRVEHLSTLLLTNSYHIKYMFVGDGVKNEVEKVIRNLRPALQLRLRYICHHGKDEVAPSGAAAS